MNVFGWFKPKKEEKNHPETTKPSPAPELAVTRKSGLRKQGAITLVLTEEEKMEVAYQLGQYKKVREIVQHFKDKGKDVSYECIEQYRRSPKWKPIIQKFQDEYNRAVLEVPLANKKKRLDEMQAMFDKAIEEEDLPFAKSLIKDFRDEMEGKVGDVSFNFTQVNHNEFHDMDDEALRREKLKALEELEMVRKIKLVHNLDPKNRIKKEGDR